MADFRYRHRPTILEAFQNNPEVIATDDPEQVPEWFVTACNEDRIQPTIGVAPTGTLSIHTDEGVMRADVGDWITLGLDGELYPVKQDRFQKLYEKVEG